MLISLLRTVGSTGRTAVLTMITMRSAAAALRALAIVLLFPVLSGLFSSAPVVPAGWTAAVVAAALAAVATARVAERATLQASQKASAGLAITLTEHAATLPTGWFDGLDQAELADLLTDGSTATRGLLRLPLAVVVTNLALTVTGVVLLLFVLPWAALALAVAMAAMFLGECVIAGPLNRASAASLVARRAAAADLVEYAQAQSVLRAFGGPRAGSGRVLRTLVGTSLYPAVVTGLVLGTVVVVGVAGGTDPARLVTATVLLSVAGATMMPFIRAWHFMLEQGEIFRRAERVLAVEPLPEPAHPATAHGGTIRFEDVSFGYQEGADVLRGVDFEVETGLTALVGASGAGKTTVLRLVSRAWDPRSGRITLGGADLRDLGTARTLDQVSIVFQDVYLIAGTLRENVLMAQPEASQAELDAAARAAALDTVVSQLPEGWHTRVGERGATLSGGQRQRVSIARALLKDARVLLLDESAAALDGETEERISSVVREMARDRTVLMVTHRLSTARDADSILVLDRGRVVERGDHEELLARQGTYAQLWAAAEGPAADATASGGPDAAADPGDGLATAAEDMYERSGGKR
jgi:ATP-binding cassette subfamily B protein